MNYFGEILSLGVAFSWTITALFSEVGSKRLGSLQLNVIRMCLSLLFLASTLWIFTGSPYPLYLNTQAVWWLCLSGFVGYVLGDYCLFNAYVLIGSRFGQLFMTLAPVAAALSAWIILGEKLSLRIVAGMAVTLSGIALSVLSRGEDNKLSFKLPLKGILLGVGAGMGQGIGLVLSKIGMNHYQSTLPANLPEWSQILPFASTFVRAVTGAAGFVLMMAFTRQFGTLKTAVRDRKGMSAALGATIFGPFVGVSVSLMAVRYTQAGIASTLMALTPIFILWPAHLFFGQKITVREILGALVSVFGVAMFFW